MTEAHHDDPDGSVAWFAGLVNGGQAYFQPLDGSAAALPDYLMERQTTGARPVKLGHLHVLSRSTQMNPAVAGMGAMGSGWHGGRAGLSCMVPPVILACTHVRAG